MAYMDDAHSTFSEFLLWQSAKADWGLLLPDLLLSFNRAPLILLLFWS